MSERLDQIESILQQQIEFGRQQMEISRQQGELHRQHSDRLDRVDNILYALAETSARNSGEIAELRGIVENFAVQLDVFVEEGREFRRRMDSMGSEIRGLQVENRRILERLEGHVSDGHGGQNL